MEEQWKSIPETDDLYEVSDQGRVRSKDRYSNNRWRPILRKGRVLVATGDGCGYLGILIFKNGKRKSAKIHRLVAELFLNKAPGLQVNHIDGDKNNNRATNLEWITHAENMKHAVSSGLITTTKRKKADKLRRKLSDSDVLEIRSLSQQGVTRTAIAKIYGVSQPTISHLLLGKTYRI